MRIPKAAARLVMAGLVRPTYGPPVPVRVQRAVGDALGRVQRLPRDVPVTGVVLGGVRAVRYGAPSGTAVVWAHGGAFLTGSARTHGSFAAHLARESGATVYLPDYRLAPEHAHPAAVDDLVAAVRAVPEARVVLGGDSAGGCLALLAAPSVSVAGLALVSPVVDLTRASSSAWTRGDVVVRSSWAAQGIGAMFPSGLPAVPDPVVPTVVHVAEVERLRPEGEALAARTGAELYLVPGGWHDIHLQCDGVRDAREAVRALGASVRRMLA